MSFTSDRPPGFALKLALSAPAKLFSAVARLRSRLYDSRSLEVIDTGLPIISIGNLTAGGTGKTPITSYFANELGQQGFSCAIVSRGYAAYERGPALVPANGDAARFGDEPSWLATQHPAVPVVIGRRRPEAVHFLRTLKNPPVRYLVLADDAFQHRRLKRDLDLVIVDATEPRWHYEPLPLGRMRESFHELSRASFILISKTNLAEESQLTWLRDQIQKARKPILEFGVRLKGFVPLAGDTPTARASSLSEKQVVLLSAIARPQTFEQLVLEAGPALKILKHFIFRDHSSFTIDDLNDVEATARQLGAQAIVVTEKDATKLRSWRPSLPVYVSRLAAEPRSDLGELYEAIRRLR